MITLIAQIETTPPNNTGPGPDHKYETLTVDAPTYDAALAAVREKVPSGWRLINVRTTYP